VWTSCQEKHKFITEDILEITGTLQLLTIYTNYKVYEKDIIKTTQCLDWLGVGISKLS
jgi:hypothetical protein